MRIIAGKFRSRQLFAPKGLKTRPTSGKLREAVFNILQGTIEGSSFLDVFAGSGGMGLEALSRGAQRAVFIENNKEAYECILKNAEILGIKDQVAVAKGDVFASFEQMHKKNERFCIIYVDPPYTNGKEIGKQEPLSLKVLKEIDRCQLLSEDGILIMEESKDRHFDEVPLQFLTLFRRKEAGISSLSFFKTQVQ